MSVLTPVIQSVDGSARRIFLRQGVSDFYPIEDIYHEYRNLRRTDESLRVWEPLLRAEGNVAKGGGAFTPRYVILIDGTKIVPYDEVLQINQLGDMITDDPDTDANLYDISGLTVPKPIFITPSEAETIQLNSASIEFASYNNGVTIDTTNITGRAKSGTKNPIGTQLTPVDNLSDAYAILNNVGLNKVYILGDLVLSGTDSWKGVQFFGESQIRTLIDVDAAVDVFNCQFYDAQINGTLDGFSQIERCIINDLDFIEGYIYRCSLGPSPIQLGTGTTANFYGCFSTIVGIGQPVIDMNATGILAVRDYNGGIRLQNYSGNDSHSLDLSASTVIMDSTTITSGTFQFRGIGQVYDENGNQIVSDVDDRGQPIPTVWNGGVTILNYLVNQENIARGVLYFDSNNIPPL